MRLRALLGASVRESWASAFESPCAVYAIGRFGTLPSTESPTFVKWIRIPSEVSNASCGLRGGVEAAPGGSRSMCWFQFSGCWSTYFARRYGGFHTVGSANPAAFCVRPDLRMAETRLRRTQFEQPSEAEAGADPAEQVCTVRVEAGADISRHADAARNTGVDPAGDFA